MERLPEVSRLWKDHLAAEFPARMRGVEFGQVDMVLLDAYIAGCVSSWLNGDGTLDAERHEILDRCLHDLNQVLPLLEDEQGADYYDRLHRMALLAHGDRSANTIGPSTNSDENEQSRYAGSGLEVVSALESGE